MPVLKIKQIKEFFITILLIFSVHINLRSQNNFYAGARTAALANAGTVITDLWASTHNQACLVSLSRPCFGYHYEDKYLESALSLQSIAGVVPVSNNIVGANITLFGNKSYYESKIGFLVAKYLRSNLSAGIQLNLLTLHQPMYYDDVFALSVEGGLYYEKENKFMVGCHFYNITNSSYKALVNNNIPIIGELGIGWRPVERLFIVIESEFNNQQRTLFKGAIEYLIISKIAARLGFST